MSYDNLIATRIYSLSNNVKVDYIKQMNYGLDAVITATNLLLKAFENDAKRAIFGEIDVLHNAGNISI